LRKMIAVATAAKSKPAGAGMSAGMDAANAAIAAGKEQLVATVQQSAEDALSARVQEMRLQTLRQGGSTPGFNRRLGVTQPQGTDSFLDRIAEAAGSTLAGLDSRLTRLTHLTLQEGRFTTLGGKSLAAPKPKKREKRPQLGRSAPKLGIQIHWPWPRVGKAGGGRRWGQERCLCSTHQNRDGLRGCGCGSRQWVCRWKC
jgi:hypothetical protein